MCGVPYPRRRRLHRPAREQGVSRRHLRAGRGSEEGQGPRAARSRSRGVAGHADRCRLSRGARAGVPAGHRARRPTRPGLRRGAARPRRPASSRPPSITAATRGRRCRRAGGAPAARDCSRPRVPMSRRRSSAELRASRRASRTADGWTFELESARRDAARPAPARRASTGFGLEERAGRRSRGRRPRPLPARHAEGRPRARARDRLPRGRGLPAHRSDHASQPRGRRGGRRRARPDRCCTRSIARSRRWAGGCCARGCCGRSSRSSASRIGSTPSRNWRFASTERAKLRETLKTMHDIERLVARAALGTAGPARSRGAAAVARGGAARAACCSPTCRRRSSRACVAELDDLRRSARRARSDARRRAAGARARRRRRSATASTPSSTTCASISRSGKQRIADDGGRRAGADRHRLAQDPLQPCVRLLHRDLEVEPRERPGRLSPQADDRRRRALHHAGAQGLRREGARRRRAHPRARDRALRARCGRGRRRGAAHPGHRARHRRARRARGARRDGRHRQLHEAARCTTATSSSPPTCATRSSSGTSPDAFVPNDVTLDGAAPPARRS